MNRYIVLIVSALTLSACAATPPGKLASSYKDLPVKTDIVQDAAATPLIVTVPTTHIPAGGLVGALIGGIATEVSRQKRAPGIREIQGVVKPEEVHALIGDSTLNTVKNASWIKPGKTLKLKNYAFSDRKAVLNNHLLETEAPTRTFVQSYAVLGEAFDNLTQVCSVAIYPVNNAKQGSYIYRLNLSSTYVPPNLDLEKGFDNYKVWTANDGAEIKKGIRFTTKDINKQLKDWLKDPHSVVDRTPKLQVDSTKLN